MTPCSRTALALALLLACSGEPSSPEQQVRAVLEAIEAAAEQRDAGELKAHISERYADAEGHDRQAVVAIALVRFRQNQSVYLLTRIREVEIPAPGQARAVALVAMAGRPIPGPEALAGLRADLYRFDVELRQEDGDWRVTGAAWQPATPADFRLE